jgi:EAL domain-containing protein (putative c-di-GMP-specific phosphodiesterase class I)
MDRDFPELLTDAARRHAVPPNCIVVEVTESALMQDPKRAEQSILELKKQGFRLSIDDYGTGYSSLAYLQRFPVDVIKIDRSFVTQLDDEGMRAVVESISAIAAVMGYKSIAEGVETDDQLDGLMAFDCKYAQGYRYSRPVSAAVLDRLLYADDARLRGALSVTAPS